MGNIDGMSEQTSRERERVGRADAFKKRNALQSDFALRFYNKMHPAESIILDHGSPGYHFLEQKVYDLWLGTRVDDLNSPAAIFGTHYKDTIDLSNHDDVLELFNSMFPAAIFPPNRADRPNQASPNKI